MCHKYSSHFQGCLLREWPTSMTVLVPHWTILSILRQLKGLDGGKHGIEEILRLVGSMVIMLLYISNTTFKYKAT